MDHFWHLTARDRWDFRIFQMSFLKILRGGFAAGNQSTTCLLHSFQIIRSLLLQNFYELETSKLEPLKRNNKEKSPRYKKPNEKFQEKSEANFGLNGDRLLGTGLVVLRTMYNEVNTGYIMVKFSHPRGVKPSSDSLGN